MPALTIQFTSSGRPVAHAEVRIDGIDAPRVTDRHGVLLAELPQGRTNGTIDLDGRAVAFRLAVAAGLSQIRIDVEPDEAPLDDPRARAVMPSDRWVPLALVGRGGTSAVYRCRDTALDRIVAVKILSEDIGSTSHEREMFLNEARTLARIQHPNLLQVYDVGVTEGRAWMVAEYIDGPNLEQMLQTDGPLRVAAAASAAADLARALAAVHQRGFIHRDVKPSNGLVDRTGRVRLADFGLVGPVIDLADPRSRIFGTPAYMSPEQIQGRPLGPAADLYSLGATLWDLLAGAPPFGGANPVLDHLTKPPPNLLDARPDAPQVIADLIRGMMAKDPADRPDALVVIDTLSPIAALAPESASSPWEPRPASERDALRIVASSPGDADQPTATARSGAPRDEIETHTMLLSPEAPVPAPEPEPTADAKTAPRPRDDESTVVGTMATATVDDDTPLRRPRWPLWLGGAILLAAVALALRSPDPEPPPPPVATAEGSGAVVATAPVDASPAPPDEQVRSLARGFGSVAAREVDARARDIARLVAQPQRNRRVGPSRRRPGTEPTTTTPAPAPADAQPVELPASPSAKPLIEKLRPIVNTTRD